MFNLSLDEYNKTVDNSLEYLNDTRSYLSVRYYAGVHFNFYEEDGIPMGKCTVAVMDMGKDFLVDWASFTSKLLVNNESGLFYGVNEAFLYEKALDFLFINPDIVIFEDVNLFNKDVRMTAAEYCFSYKCLQGIEVSNPSHSFYMENPSGGDLNLVKKAPYFKNVKLGNDYIGTFIPDYNLAVKGLGFHHLAALDFLFIYDLLDENHYPKVLKIAKKLSKKDFNNKIHSDFLKNACFDICTRNKSKEYINLLDFFYKKGFFDRLTKKEIKHIFEYCDFEKITNGSFYISSDNYYKGDRKYEEVYFGILDNRKNFLSEKFSFPIDGVYLSNLENYLDKVLIKNSREQKEFLKDLKKKA